MPDQTDKRNVDEVEKHYLLMLLEIWEAHALPPHMCKDHKGCRCQWCVAMRKAKAFRGDKYL